MIHLLPVLLLSSLSPSGPYATVGSLTINEGGGYYGSPQLKYVSAFGHTWEARHGTGGMATWDASKVSRLKDGRVRLDQNGGIKNPAQLGYGTYTVELEGRLDSIPAYSCFAVWMYDDRSDRPGWNELDFEVSQWRDQNLTDRIQLGLHRVDGTTEKSVFPLGSFDRHRVTLEYQPGGCGVRYEGWLVIGNRWKEVCARHWLGKYPLGMTVRVGYWLMEPLSGASKGVPSIWMTRFDFKPHKPSP